MNDCIYRFTTWVDGKGRHFARCGDLEADSMSSAIAALARVIRGLDSVPDGPIHAYWPDGRRSLTVRSLYWMADRTIAEDDKAGIRVVRWKPSPFAKVAA